MSNEKQSEIFLITKFMSNVVKNVVWVYVLGFIVAWIGFSYLSTSDWAKSDAMVKALVWPYSTVLYVNSKM